MPNALDVFLDQTPWRRQAYNEICATPTGQLVSYGVIADIVDVSPRNIGWLRRELYRILSHETNVPLHRVACQGDVYSLKDSEKTRQVNTRLRTKEGSLQDPVWRTK
ncbi:hypothetical protein DB345_09345 [Spartobacteria bacterium LR76]|nr:hypothetical protein DB345_09345 [Spartobacteria bacterium LR76]